jgi:predicted TIM-barrel fold metal-dependent hydrolase
MSQSATPITIVSLDGHTQVPENAWPEYLETRYHDLLPGLSDENARWIDVMGRLMVDRINDDVGVFDLDGEYRNGGLRGIFDLDERLRQMDREGIAGEFLYNGEPRQMALFFQQTNAAYAAEACEAGARAHHRWVHDTFGASDRILLTGVTGHAPCRDIEATLAETRWIADHGFVATMAPGSTGYADMPPLYHEYWDPLWALCAERGLTVVVHAGYGTPAGPFFREVSDVYDEMQRTGEPSEVVMARFNTVKMVEKFFDTIGTRRPLWQFTLGGVFDRHPGLKLLLTEIRADWQPALLGHLDERFDADRGSVPATRRPSEYWETNCMTCLSFAHRAEVEMRHEIGIDTIAFGRDYPHPEGTWPNTTDWIRDAFAGVPEAELRMMLGENAIRRLGLDGDALTRAAAEVGPTFGQLMGPGPAVPAGLLDHFELRGGYHKPAEGGARLPESAPSVDTDLTILAGRAS